jgi:hypothetical protein
LGDELEEEWDILGTLESPGKTLKSWDMSWKSIGCLPIKWEKLGRQLEIFQLDWETIGRGMEEILLSQ